MDSIKSQLRQMALNPKAQMKRLLFGTLGSLLCMLLLIMTNSLENQWLFYGLSLMLVLSIIYAIPGYIGIWMWRMRKTFFNLD